MICENYNGFQISLGDDSYWHLMLDGRDIERFALRADAKKFCNKPANWRRSMDIEVLRRKLALFSKAELIDELIGALTELASPRSTAGLIGCMRDQCQHQEKCTEAWKCLNPMHS